MDRFYQAIVDRPISVLAILAWITGGLGYFAAQTQFDSSIESLLPAGAPELDFYHEVRRQFGSDEIGLVAIIAPETVFETETFQKIQRLSTAIREVAGVEDVMSLMTIVDYGADVAAPPRFVREVPTTPEGWSSLREKLAERPLYVKNLVSESGRAAAIHISFGSLSDDEYQSGGIDEAIQAIVDREQGPERLHYSGLPHIKAYSLRAMVRDLRRLVPVTLGVVLAVLAVSFRSLRGMLLPALTVVVSLVWTLGVMVLTGGRLTVASVPLPPLMLALGTAYALHVVAEYYELVGPDRSRAAIVVETLRRTAPPVLITALTTGVGFLSLGVNPIGAIREMGVYSAIGIFFSFVLSVVLVPAILALLPVPARVPGASFAAGVGVRMQRVGAAAIRRRALVIAGAVGISIVSIWQMRSIEVESSFESFFDPSDPSYQATEAINEHLGGAMAFHVVLDSEVPGSMGRLDGLRRIRDLQRFIETLPGVHTTVSFVDFLELVDQGSKGGGGDILITESGEIIETPMGDSSATLWESPAQFTAVMGLVKANLASLSRFVTPDLTRSNVLVKTSVSKATEISALVEKIREYSETHLLPEQRARATGTLILNASTTRSIVSGQIESLLLAAGVIFVVMAGMFLSMRVGLTAMVPNLFPILFFFGLMGASGIVLSLSTSIIASIVLGIAVDDTVHLMTRLSTEVRRTGDQNRALLRTLDTVGKPCLFSTIFLSLGFLVLTGSTFVPIREFGMLAAAALVMALAGDVVLLPALIATQRIITLWDVLYLRLGKDPQRTIPIFASLRPTQAKIVALMGELRSFQAGEAVVRQGELGDEMFVILDGRAEVRVHSDGRLHSVRELGRGEVFGEMGLVRHHERTADVVARSDVEVMAVNDRSLERLQRRYPRIAARIYRNISRILSDRLQDQTIRSVT